MVTKVIFNCNKPPLWWSHRAKKTIHFCFIKHGSEKNRVTVTIFLPISVVYHITVVVRIGIITSTKRKRFGNSIVHNRISRNYDIVCGHIQMPGGIYTIAERIINHAGRVAPRGRKNTGRVVKEIKLWCGTIHICRPRIKRITQRSKTPSLTHQIQAIEISSEKNSYFYHSQNHDKKNGHNHTQLNQRLTGRFS
ncbi:MAG: DUF4751 family protein [Anaerolineaceae bacterium]|nr:DUF4751 family protein [Anaerolineaceae bacterium]